MDDGKTVKLLVDGLAGFICQKMKDDHPLA